MLFTKEILITGKVQGVFFRKYACEAADAVGVTGFVKNLPDQSVYILATGTNEQLQEFINWCWQGSPRSKVENVEVKEMELKHFNLFQVER
ncbi:MAG: acylphosphatase [Chitinophagaceae bacterium]|nr:acylphosphatase [Chitinophagaceae bacterium]